MRQHDKGFDLAGLRNASRVKLAQRHMGEANGELIL
jgi:hypothetical protein